MGTFQTYIKVWERDSGVAEPDDDDPWGEMYFHGYGWSNVHQFVTKCSVPGPSNSGPCNSAFPGWELQDVRSVDIVYQHKTNGSYDTN
jgi:hypothetical protein